MANEMMGEFILALRKEQGLTQKQLAEKINVTDKAVSKWERGLGHPDITILTELADVLGVSASELLAGKREVDPQTRQVVDNTISYAKKMNLKRFKFSLKLARWMTSILCLIALGICLIVNVAVERKISWSAMAVAGIGYGWITTLACLSGKRYWWIWGLLAASVLLLPMLMIVEHFSWEYVGDVVNGNWLWTIAVPISLISLGYAWIVCLVATFLKWNWLSKLGLVTALAPAVELGVLAVLYNVGIQRSIDWWDWIDMPIIFGLGLLLLLWGYWRSKKSES